MTTDTLEELFERDPLELNDEDIDSIVAGLRAMRVRFNVGDTKAGSIRKPKTSKVVAESGLSGMLEIKL